MDILTSYLSTGFGLVLVYVITNVMDMDYGSPASGLSSLFGYLESSMAHFL